MGRRAALVSGNTSATTRYDGSSQPISLTFGGQRQDYQPNTVGKFNGWITRRP